MDSERIEALAAEWVVRKHDDNWTEARQVELESWLDQSAAHRVAYLRLSTALQQTDRLQALRAGVPPGVVPPSGSWNTAQTGNSLNSTQAGVDMTRRPWNRMLSLAAGLILALIGGLYLLVVQIHGEDRYATRVGGLETVTLADGSQVTLNTSTQVRVALRATERRIDLDSGEAFFVVAKDPSRPFVIHIADKRVVAVGTEFSVRRSGNADIQVLVTEGRVQLLPSASSTSAQATALKAGTIARTLNNEVLVQTASEAETEQLLSWRGGFVMFRETPLAEAVEEFNRYSARKLIVADPSIGAIRIGGKFRSSNVEAFLALLQQGFPVEVEQSGSHIVLKRRT